MEKRKQRDKLGDKKFIMDGSVMRFLNMTVIQQEIMYIIPYNL